MKQETTYVRNQTFVGTPKPDGADNHAHSPERGATNIFYQDCVFDANGASEALKLSRHWDIEVWGGKIIGGVEDGVDIVRGGNITFRNVLFEQVPGQQQDVTCKGSARNIGFHDCVGLKKLVFGQYTKYDLKAFYPDGHEKKAALTSYARPPTRDIVIARCGDPVVETWHSEVPSGAFRRAFWPHHIALLYFFLRSKFPEKLPPAPSEFYLYPEEL